MGRRSQEGFTLIELVVVVMITTITAGLIVSFVTRPMEGYSALRMRGDLVDMADNAMRRMARDVHRALPNSLRVSVDGRTLELLHTVEGFRYRGDRGTNPPPSPVNHTADSDWLDFTGDQSFNIFGRLSAIPFSYGTALPAGHRLAIYTTDVGVYTDAAGGANPGVITPSTSSITVVDDTDEDQFTISSSHTFRFRSPRQRVYLVDTPISYGCDVGSGTLTRYSTYAITAAQPTNPALTPLSSAVSGLIATHLAGCSIEYDPGTSTRTGLVTITLLIEADSEPIRLLRQVHVESVP